MLRTKQLRDAPITSLMNPDNSHHTKILQPLFLKCTPVYIKNVWQAI